MAANKKRAFDGLYAQLEEVNNHVVLFAAKGEPSVIFEMTNPVQQLCTDAEQYLRFQDVLSNIVQTLGEGYALQKQDVFCKQSYHHEVPEDAEFLTRSYFRYFEGREFTEIRTFLILTQEAQRSQFVQYDPKNGWTSTPRSTRFPTFSARSISGTRCCPRKRSTNTATASWLFSSVTVRSP